LKKYRLSERAPGLKIAARIYEEEDFSFRNSKINVTDLRGQNVYYTGARKLSQLE
jgi:hypothetical protein